MRKDTNISEAGRQYITAHATHYGREDLRESLELYLGLIAAHLDTQESEYSHSQVQNIVREVVSRQEFLDVPMVSVFAHFEHTGQPRIEKEVD